MPTVCTYLYAQTAVGEATGLKHIKACLLYTSQTIHIEELIGPKGKGQKNMRDLSPEAIYKYACEDADVTLKLKNNVDGNGGRKVKLWMK